MEKKENLILAKESLTEKKENSIANVQKEENLMLANANLTAKKENLIANVQKEESLIQANANLTERRENLRANENHLILTNLTAKKENLIRVNVNLMESVKHQHRANVNLTEISHNLVTEMIKENPLLKDLIKEISISHAQILGINLLSRKKKAEAREAINQRKVTVRRK